MTSASAMLEQVQRRAATYVTNRYHNTSSASAMLEQVQRRAATYVTKPKHCWYCDSGLSRMLLLCAELALALPKHCWYCDSGLSRILLFCAELALWFDICLVLKAFYVFYNPTLEHRRSLSRIAMLYKITDNLIAVDPKLYLTPQPSLSTRNNNSQA
jgi:arginyl-tRNA--protein-N-Asp/Glu arginylyltransferase